jgi:hypothetical protein
MPDASHLRFDRRGDAIGEAPFRSTNVMLESTNEKVPTDPNR